ncbi:MAG: transketolase, partial [Syntrophales bacterium]
EMDYEGLRETAREMRINILRMIHCAKSGHTGGSLSAADLMTALYFHVMEHRPGEPEWPGRDRFVLSKGHAAPALYSALAMRGYFDAKELMTLRRLNSRLQGHPDMLRTRGVNASSGSLGQGLSIANGIAMGLRLDGNEAAVFVMLGDGENQEGQVWEAAMTAAHFRLGKVLAIVDNNGLQIDGAVKDVMGIEPLAQKWDSFGWDVETVDGHDFGRIIPALLRVRKKGLHDRPSVVIARTIKGKGASVFEGKAKYHGVAPSDQELEAALQELGEV